MSDAILNVEKISKSFGALQASDAVTLDLRAGEIHALIGPNGAGKSTLIAQIAGRLKPDTGTISLLGQDVTKLSVAERANLGLGRTFQISELAMDFTVLENVMLGALGKRGSVYQFFHPVLKDGQLRGKADSAIERVGLSGHTSKLAFELSHGQRRQLEVAIALTMQPKLFLMDEPMAGMGAEGSKTLTGFLDGLRHEAPILLVEHDMDAVFALADRISVLVYGKIIATGSVDHIRNHEEVRRVYLGEGR